ncbi:MAG: hypothetical protein IJA16_00065 [Clostridia bacterium]|nr:hypothetical protein [Clostridia bacterium]
MKKLFSLLLCMFMLLSVSSCKKGSDTDGARLNDIPTASADAEGENVEISEDDDSQDADTSDRTPETDREEIKNNLRDAKELIENGSVEDAAMIIKSLQTRDLTDEEEKQLKELQKQMIKISD